MFNNIGDKIKNLATACTIIGIIISIVAGFILMIEISWWLGLIIIVCGCFIFWIASFVIYGFGEIIDKLCEISKQLSDQKKLSVAKALKCKESNKNKANEIIDEVVSITLEEIESEVDNEDDVNKPKSNECPCCFYKIKPTDKECPNCGFKLK